jgi:hypothetical protein
MKIIKPILLMIGASLLGSDCSQQKTVARVIYNEARGEGKAGMACVADVIYERMNNLNAYQVVTAPMQFDGINYNNVNWQSKEAKFCLELADKLQRGQDIILDHRFTHFYSGKAPYWAFNQKKTVIGNHTFLELQ